MNASSEINKLLLSQYETKAYLSLVAKYPLNGSQLSKHSGIPSAKIYEVLRNLLEKGLYELIKNDAWDSSKQKK
ncbi:MAG: hypothetical protein BBJ60_03575 [Desulfobacterales bacterium S7086C20]|nr:MAG: hypothetical protein BBJ60_03575 [Desulfobacterales bacterium S7086C20]